MADENIQVEFRITQTGLKELQKALDEVEKNLQDIGVQSKEIDKALKPVAGQIKQIGSESNKAAGEMGKVADEAGQLAKTNENIITQRYALYDLASTYAAIGAALVGIGVYATVTGARYESAFTNVERTSSATSESLKGLQRDLINLSGTMPITFEQLSSIATLGNQLGIAENDILDFTETVSKFSALTGISVEETALSFGRIGQLLGIPVSQYENLASSITLVATNSAATEAQILALTKELAAGGRGAGLAADDVVALSATLASLGVAPERARGALDTYFNTLNRAVARGGADLNNFAQIVGVTTDQLSNMVRSGEGSEILERFISGLGDLDSTGATQALDALNLSQLRVDNTFRRLSQNLSLYQRLNEDAFNGYIEGRDLSDRYAKTLDDLNSQWIIFTNNLNNFIAIVSGGAVTSLAGLLQGVNNLFMAFNDLINQNDVVKWALGLVVAATGLVGAYVLVRASVLTVRASMLAYLYILRQTQAASTGQAITNRYLVGTFLGVGGASRAAGVSLRFFRAALASTGVGLAALFIGEVASRIMDSGDAAGDAQLSMEEYNRAMEDARNAANGAGGAMPALADGTEKAGEEARKAAEKFRTLVDYASDLSNVLRRSFDIRFGSQDALDKINSAWNQLNSNIAETRAEVASLTADKSLREYWLSVAEAYGDTVRAGQLRAELIDIENKLAKAQEKANTELDGTNSVAINNRKNIRDLINNYQEYIQSLASSGLSQEQLAQKVDESRADFIAQATALGYSTVEIEKYAQAFDDMGTIIDRVPRNVTVNFDPNPALQALNEFFATAEARAALSGDTAGDNFSNNFGSMDLPIPEDPYPTAAEDGEKAAKNWYDGWADGIKGVTKDILQSIVNALMKANPAVGLLAGILANNFLKNFNPFIDGLFKPLDNSRIIKDAEKAGIDVGKLMNNNTKSSLDLGSVVTNNLNSSKPKVDQSTVSLAGGAGRMFNTSIGGTLDPNIFGRNISSQSETAANNALAVGRGAAINANSSLSSNLDLSGRISGNVWAAKSPAEINASSIGSAIGRNISNGISGLLDMWFGYNRRTGARGFINSITGFAEGGYTGAGGKYEPAGIVHRGEYVVPKKYVNQATGTPDMAYLSKIANAKSAPRGAGYANGGMVSGGQMIVSLSAEDRAILRSAGGTGNIVLYADSRELARAVNDGNRQIVASGGRP